MVAREFRLGGDLVKDVALGVERVRVEVEYVSPLLFALVLVLLLLEEVTARARSKRSAVEERLDFKCLNS